jgi:ABC-type multidrug transport system fused ATPase/permease subunit
MDVFISIADIVFLALLLFIINIYTQTGWADKFHFLPAWLLDNRSLLLITLFLLLYGLKNLIGYFIYRAQCRYICDVASRIAEDRLLKYLEGPYADYVDIDSSVHIRKVAHEPVEFSQHILGGIQEIVTQAVLILLSIAGMVFFNAKMFLLLFVILLPPVIIAFYMVRRKLRSVKTHAQASIERSLQHLQESLSGYVESNVYNKSRFFLNRYAGFQRKFNRYFSELLIVQGIPNRMMEIFALLGLFILIAISKWNAGQDGSTILLIGAFMAAAYKIIPGMVKILTVSSQIKTYEFTVDNLLDASLSSREDASPDPAPPIKSVSFKDIRFLYSRQPVLDQLNFELHVGDFAGLSGPSGKGKTTILHLILGFLSPAGGDILINDIPTDDQTRKLFRQRFSYVKQQSFLIHDTILRNITLDDKPHDEKKLQEVIKVAGLSLLIDSFPDKLNEIVAENGKNISGGQRQRLAIARALYKEADVIVLDEPFNELDEASELVMLEHLSHLARQGKMIILITHNKKSLSFCNKIISLDEKQA